MPIAAVTRLRLRPDAGRLSFFWLSLLSWWQARQAEGNMGSRVRKATRNEFWTLTVWRDQATLMAFVTNGTHRTAMPKLGKWCDESSSARWELDDFEVPSWRTAMTALGRYGRIHRVATPSPAQIAGLPLGSRETC
ncbi:MAG: DUF3291 domain-containing protein [Alphaproteobacteria bacterium]|nr:DUF3291 domain-containing protein [Alphaproteobacteria bacterium]